MTTDDARLLETAQSILALYKQGLLGFRQHSHADSQLRIALPPPLANGLRRRIRKVDTVIRAADSSGGAVAIR